MAKRSVFRDFIAALKKHWRTAFPSVRPLGRSFGLFLPKASSFYAGVARPQGLHVCLNFQHPSKSWQVGQFTINIVLSQDQVPHEVRPVYITPEDPASLTEGSYRIGPFSGGKDKWWHLKDEKCEEAWQLLNDIIPSVELIGAWRPTSYNDPEAVLREAVADVSRDVQAVLHKLGVSETPAATP